MLYIVRFLHQTTTFLDCAQLSISCISSVSYIKPQLWDGAKGSFSVVYRPFPTSNHNHGEALPDDDTVVYRPFPTSNHNKIVVLFYR